MTLPVPFSLDRSLLRCTDSIVLVCLAGGSEELQELEVMVTSIAGVVAGGLRGGLVAAGSSETPTSAGLCLRQIPVSRLGVSRSVSSGIVAQPARGASGRMTVTRVPPVALLSLVLEQAEHAEKWSPHGSMGFSQWGQECLWSGLRRVSGRRSLRCHRAVKMSSGSLLSLILRQ